MLREKEKWRKEKKNVKGEVGEEKELDELLCGFPESVTGVLNFILLSVINHKLHK